MPERLRGYRRVQGISQKEFGRRLGLDESTVVRWEKGRSRPIKAAMRRLRDLLKLVPQTDLLPARRLEKDRDRLPG